MDFAFYFLGNACLELYVLFGVKKVSSVVVLPLDFVLTLHNKILVLKAPA